MIGILTGSQFAGQEPDPDDGSTVTKKDDPIPEPPKGRGYERLREISRLPGLDGLDKAVILYDLEHRLAYRREIDDRDAQIEAEFSIPTPYALSILEHHLRNNPGDVEARALLVKYLCFASIHGPDEVNIDHVRRAETEARIVGQKDTLEARASIRRLRVELAGYFATFPTNASRRLMDFLDARDVARP